MTLGIIPNITKENISEVISKLVEKLQQFDFKYFISNEIINTQIELPENVDESVLVSNSYLASVSDILISIGGDGTMLHTAYSTLNYNKPIIGINFGKLGFLAEFNIDEIDILLEDLKKGNYEIEERIMLEGECLSCKDLKLFGINDIVIDKGGWPKMIEISIKVNDDYVTTFTADGLILSTPTGSTGYSLSVGGPIVTPKTNVITVSPISPHSLTTRPLILESNSKIYIKVNSNHKNVQINCDGERVHNFKPSVELLVYRSPNTIKLIRTKSINYFKTLREKLLWGLDVRKNILGENK